ncbi:MAG: hypothetical protein METHAR1v1_1010006 [Methanothrix sp.]|nr:MAG: hypothetical protein METHAR1v1_1010006 [Methanothrix sp.]
MGKDGMDLRLSRRNHLKERFTAIFIPNNT